MTVKYAHCLLHWVPTVNFKLDLACKPSLEVQLVQAGPAHKAFEVHVCTITISLEKLSLKKNLFLQYIR